MNTCPSLTAEDLAILPRAAAVLQIIHAQTSPGRPLYGLAGRAVDSVDQVRRELAKFESSQKAAHGHPQP